VLIARGGASQQAPDTSVMGRMIGVVILALSMVPVFFVVARRALAGCGGAAGRS
jgi:multidrug efflux pump